MAAGWHGGNSKTLEWVGMGVRVGRAVGGEVAGVAGFFFCGGGAVVASLRVDHDLRGAGGLGGGGGRRQGLRTWGVPHRFYEGRDGWELTGFQPVHTLICLPLQKQF